MGCLARCYTGIGCVLVFWLFIGGGCATVAAILLGVVVRRVSRASGIAPRRWVLAASFLPFLTLAYGLVAFVGYAIWCENVRGVDPGLGDSWVIPVGQGCTLDMVDQPDNAQISGPHRELLLEGVTRLAVAGEELVGESHGKFYAVNLREHTKRSLESEGEAVAALKRSGSKAPALLPVNDFYIARRWSYLDVLAALGIAAIPAAVSIALLLAFRRALRRATLTLRRTEPAPPTC